MSRPIFLGGTGRSGTTLLYEILGRHRSVHAFPIEMRLLVDPDGALDLVESLTSTFSPVRAREALYRFERLMTVYFTTPKREPYRPFDFRELLGEDYVERVRSFCRSLEEARFTGRDWQLQPRSEGKLVAAARAAQGLRRRLRGRSTLPTIVDLDRPDLAVVSYQQRPELVAKLRDLIGGLFGDAARAHGKETWCEKTPHNLLHLDFLWEVFPDAAFVHITRDPRGVAHSLRNQFWAPDDLEGACRYLLSVYQRWFAIEPTLGLSERRYQRVKLEDLCRAPEEALADVCLVAELSRDAFDTLPELALDKVTYWREAMTEAELELSTRLLHPYIEKLDYDVDNASP